jgi:hypothetical protein
MSPPQEVRIDERKSRAGIASPAEPLAHSDVNVCRELADSAHRAGWTRRSPSPLSVVVRADMRTLGQRPNSSASPFSLRGRHAIMDSIG